MYEMIEENKEIHIMEKINFQDLKIQYNLNFDFDRLNEIFTKSDKSFFKEFHATIYSEINDHYDSSIRKFKDYNPHASSKYDDKYLKGSAHKFNEPLIIYNFEPFKGNDSSSEKMMYFLNSIVFVCIEKSDLDKYIDYVKGELNE